MKTLLLILLLLTSSCKEEGKIDYCVNLEFNRICKEVSKRGVGTESCANRDKNWCVSEEYEIFENCCRSKSSYSIFRINKH